jgi:hypothetical protein
MMTIEFKGEPLLSEMSSMGRAGSVSCRAYEVEWDRGLVWCSSGLQNAERDPGGFGEAEATSGGGNGLLVTTPATK